MFIKNNSNFKTILFIIFAIFLIWGVSQIKEIALLFFGSFVIACSLNPLADKLETKMPRSVATTILIIVTAAIALLVFFPVIFVGIKEFKTIFDLIPETIKNINHLINSTQILGHNLNEFISFDTDSIDSNSMTGHILNQSLAITMGIIDSVTVILSMGMIVFYLVLEKREINKSLLLWFPPKIKRRAAKIITAIETKVGGYIFAQVLSMSTVAFFTVLGLLLCNIKYAFLLGIIAGILDIIPIVGPTIALILGCLTASMNGLIWIIPTVIIYLTAQWISNQLVRPIVFGKFLQLHPLIVLLSFFVAAKCLGVWGVIVAPAIAATVFTLLDELYIKTINESK